MHLLIGVASPRAGRDELDLVAALKFRALTLALANVVDATNVTGLAVS